MSKGLPNFHPPKLQINNRTDTDVKCEFLFRNSQTLIIKCTNESYVAESDSAVDTQVIKKQSAI